MSAGSRRSLVAAGLGNALEWFDWTLYATFAVYIAGNFFAPGNPTSSLLATMAVFAAAFVARPLGGVAFGRLGDRVGRKAAMVTSMAILAGSSLLLAVLPTYGQTGIWASALLVLVRIVQGFAHGGEVGVIYTYVAEVAPPRRRGLWSSSVYMSITVGVMSATLLATVLTGVLGRDAMMAWGWRIGFAVGGVLGLFALWMRRNAVETEAFQSAEALTKKQEDRLSRSQITVIAARIVALSVGINVGYYTWVTFMPSVAITRYDMSPSTAFAMSLLAQAAVLVALPVFGYLSDTLGRKPMALAHGVAIVVLAFPIARILGNAPWTLFTAQLLGLFAWALMGAMYPALIAEQVPTRVRAVVVGTVASLSVAIFGGTGPYLSTWLQSINREWMFQAYVMALGVVCILGALSIRESRGVDLAQGWYNGAPDGGEIDPPIAQSPPEQHSQNASR